MKRNAVVVSIVVSLVAVAAYATTTRYKSIIGKQDVQVWDGARDTFSRRTSSGGTITLNKIDWVGVDVHALQGARTSSAISRAVGAIGNNEASIFLDPGTWEISADLTIPANVGVVVPQGCTISISSGVTLTINGPVEAGSYQIFDTSSGGTVALGDTCGSTFFPQHFGAKGDGSTDDTDEMQDWADTITSVSGEVPVTARFPEHSKYVLNDTIDLDHDNITVLAHDATFIPLSDVTLFDFNSGALADGSVVRYNVKWYGGFFDYGDTPTTLIATAIDLTRVRRAVIDGARFRGIKNCIEGDVADNVTVTNCYFRNFNKAYYIPDFNTSSRPQNIYIDKCNFTTKAGITAYGLYALGTFSDVVLSHIGYAATTGGLAYVRTDGTIGESTGLTIRDVTTEQMTNQTIIKIDANSGTDDFEGLRVLNCNIGSSGATYIDADRLDGDNNISGNWFVNAAATAIKIGDTSDADPIGVRVTGSVYIGENRFEQSSGSSGTLWSINAQASSRTQLAVRFGSNWMESSPGTMDAEANTYGWVSPQRAYVSIASASTIAVPEYADKANISGTTDINTITATYDGHIVTFFMNSTATLKDGTGNLDLGADYTDADTGITLYCDGTTWRRVN